MLTPATRAVFLRLSSIDQARLRQSADVAQDLENKWRAQAYSRINAFMEHILSELERTGELDTSKVDFTNLLVSQAIDVQREALDLATSDMERHIDPRNRLKRGPRSFSDLFELWTRYRTRKIVPKRQKDLADAIKKQFLKKVQDVFKKHSEGFRAGDDFSKAKIYEGLQKAAKTTYSRAKMIVETETTYHYNQTRRTVYDASPDVAGYLFLAIRDSATTKWCRTRSGLVYKKGDPLLDEETPPIHWNCRSEMLPLTYLNPRHLVLLEDPKLDRRRHTCEPLPRGWNSRRIAA